MKTDFQNGDPLYAEDLNDNFANLDNRIVALEANITISAVTQAQYDAIPVKDPDVLYVIVP